MEKLRKLINAMGKTLIVLAVVTIFCAGLMVLGTLVPILLYVISTILIIAIIYKFYKEGWKWDIYKWD